MFVPLNSNLVNIGETSSEFIFNGKYKYVVCYIPIKTGVNDEPSIVFVDFDTMIKGYACYNSRKQMSITTKEGTVYSYGMTITYTENSIKIIPASGITIKYTIL